MLDYLNIRYNQYTPQITIKDYTYIKNIVISLFNRCKELYQSRPYYVPSNHVLIQYCNTIDSNIYLNDYEYYQSINDRVLDTATDFGLTTPINSGIIHHGAFYGNNREIILGKKGLHHPRYLAHHWDILEPIRVLRHNVDNIDYTPIAKVDSNNSGIYVIEIDFIQLLFQYRGFKLRYSDNDRVFLAKYPLVNMLKSHINQCILNNILKKASIPSLSFINRGNNPYLPIPEYSLQLRNIQKSAYDQFITRGWDIGNIVSAIPTIFGNKVIDLIKIDTLLNRQNAWGYIYSILPLLYYCCYVSKEYSHSSNSTNFANIKNMLDRMGNDSVWNKTVMNPVRLRVKEELSAFTSLITK